MAVKANFEVVKNFDEAPDSMLVSIPSAILLAGRSRASIYRHIKAGELGTVKVGHSTRIRVGDLRKLIQANGGAV